MILGLIGFNALACDIKVAGKWYEDMPCCVAKLCKEGYKRCDKLSLKDFNEVNKLREKISKSYTQLSKCEDEEMKVSIKEEINILDKELKNITGLNYGEVFVKCTF